MKIFTTRNRAKAFFLPFYLVLLVSCHDQHLITDSKYLSLTDSAFTARKQLAVNRDSALFSVFKKKLSVQQTEALKFLYAYMPLSDLADYNGDFFLANADISLKTRSEASWGKSIPDNIFLHYVLPYRINNENLDSFRIKCYDEIAQRIRGKDIKAAALEINHWCHEKVNYQPADIRTSSPLNTILSARGRCGEESTFTVSALRTAGIPARQVYTPRWAHTDDNHAWVEIWADGKWYYLGACEPEPVLDRGWFTEPARRAMLVHTKSFGAAYGNENAISYDQYFTNVNNLAKYAITKKVFVKVVDDKNSPVTDATVEYQLYNYAEFYPLALVPTDFKGLCSFETGLGDLLIWAHKGNSFDFRKISVSETDTLLLSLNNKIPDGESYDLDLDVPVVLSPLPDPVKELTDENAGLLKLEDNIRNQYIASWIKPADAAELAVSLKMDSARVKKNIVRSMGNYKEIVRFLSGSPDTLHDMALNLLDVLPDKDLRDTKAAVLLDHLSNSPGFLKTDGLQKNYDLKFYVDYVLNPRIANEQIVSWRTYFLKKLPGEIRTHATDDPVIIRKYLEAIRIADNENYYHTPLTPEGVNELKVSDQQSRAICFVAVCRTLGIPARLEPGRNIPQYFMDDRWNDVFFADQGQPGQIKGYVKFLSQDTKPVPEYYIQFTLARFENGRYNTLEYDFNKKITDFDELALPPGHYMLITGHRLVDGRILSNMSFFSLSADEHKIVNVNCRKNEMEHKILGVADLQKIFELAGKFSPAQSCTKANGQVLIWTDPEKEPSKHIFNDLPLLKNDLDSWGGNFMFLSESGAKPQTVGLPDNSVFVKDKDLSCLDKYIRFKEQVKISLPLVIISNSDGGIIYYSTGYTIGIGDQILKALR
jgi:transglutaminase-like putative cysteine protease